MINLYQVLGLSAHATDVQIRQALNTHAQTLDPKVIKAVNEWLLNPAVRPNYDAKLQTQEPHFFTSPQGLSFYLLGISVLAKSRLPMSKMS